MRTHLGNCSHELLIGFSNKIVYVDALFGILMAIIAAGAKFFVETFFYDKEENCFDLTDYLDARLLLSKNGLLKGEEKMVDCIMYFHAFRRIRRKRIAFSVS